jgi:hypothetical protein
MGPQSARIGHGGWAVRYIVFGAMLAVAAPAWGQGTAASLGKPKLPPTVRSSGSSSDSFFDEAPQPAAKLGVIGTAPEGASAEEQYNWGSPAKRPVGTKTSLEKGSSATEPIRGAKLNEPPPGRSTSSQGPVMDWMNDVGDSINNIGTGGSDRLSWQSDSAYPNFVSPISNPFLAEDPRSLTEVRPLFIYQTIPNDNYPLHGGNAMYFGLQGRLAFTERFSLVLHKLGGVSLNPDDKSMVAGGNGFGEIWISPKFAFWRDLEKQSIWSGGLMFQIPTGSSSVFQDTGSLSIVPYLSYGRRLFCTSMGDINLINSFGYAFSSGSERSDYLYNTASLSWDAGGWHWLYPMLEMSWFHYTSDGTTRPNYTIEGRDLANLGAHASGTDYLTIAPGVRFKISESMQLGVSTEFPLLGGEDLMSFRLGIDFIWRY